MDRHILGTFTNEEDTVIEVKRLIEEEDYASDELTLVIDKHGDYNKRLNTFKEVHIEQVEVEEETVWEKIKDTFSFGSYDSKASHSILEDYGVPHDQADHYMDALKEGEIILLADSDAPKSTELSEVNEEIVMKERNDMVDNNKENQPLDEVNSEEEDAIKNKDNNPEDVKTSESKQTTESIDPSQAENMREDNTAEGDSDSSSDEKPDGEDLKQNKEEDPDLTGEEETVDAEESKHGHGNKIAKGVVRPEAKSPLNTDDKEEKDPSEESEAPESDANYPEQSEESGMKSEE
ncbi:general stress protein [Alkalibacterium olivapovliticus]|uniref:Heat induced stress protein YflT n=1 Tax=Alkalibacterium olivapovliticus TaxID=99907 RepID=A0A2T0WBQ6_9LACT|nr:general stress protein [Alkalibacterium olivapovliticus]PRY84150.1 heat induced stress protein YflT [Alkalibacterium olivapovliticus]